MADRSGLVARVPAPVRNLAQWWEWRSRGYEAPLPPPVKRATLLRNGLPGSTWIETGTYRGETTAYLAARFPRVITIEPADELFRAAQERFSGEPRVQVLHGTSEEALPLALEGLSGDVSFWLDGHYSGGVTFNGPQVTPVVNELAAIADHRAQLGDIVLLVDDVRLFGAPGPEGQGYPTVSVLTDWADAQDLRWRFEHDIFVATSR
jgi:hypothetical protein